MKQCNKCLRDLPMDAFYVRAGRRAARCRACYQAAATARYQSSPEVRAARKSQAAARYAANRAAANAKSRAYQQKHRDRLNALQRGRYLMARYGLTVAEYETLLAKQNGVCAICRGTDQHGNRLSVDHDHATEAVRGLLCDFCNRAIGLLGDDADRATAMARYLSS